MNWKDVICEITYKIKNNEKKTPKYDYTKLYVKCIAFTTVGMSEWGCGNKKNIVKTTGLRKQGK